MQRFNWMTEDMRTVRQSAEVEIKLARLKINQFNCWFTFPKSVEQIKIHCCLEYSQHFFSKPDQKGFSFFQMDNSK